MEKLCVKPVTRFNLRALCYEWTLCLSSNNRLEHFVVEEKVNKIRWFNYSITVYMSTVSIERKVVEQKQLYYRYGRCEVRIPLIRYLRQKIEDFPIN